jgi:hypothetical protein
MAMKRLTDAVTEPVSLSEAKAHLRVSSTTDDTYITGLIKIARQLCEEFTGRAFITQTWEYSLDRFPSTQGCGSGAWWDGVRDGPISQVDGAQRFLELPVGPLIAVSSFATLNDAGASTSFDSANYIVDTRAMPPKLTLATGATWPVDLRPANAILITFTAGYGPNASDVPALLKHAVYVTISHLYENREAPLKLPEGAVMILNQFKVQSIR